MVDGFVNDFNKSQRRGLHARTSDEMATEDKVATLPVGLPSFQKTFNQSVQARIDSEVRDVMRHGLMHGMLTNYDNKYIAAKAWCLLFAVCDWADDEFCEDEQCGQEVVNPEEQFLDALETAARIHKENIQVRVRLDEWDPHSVVLDNPAEDDISVIADIGDFLESWKTKNYGRLSTYLPDFTRQSKGQRAGEARAIFSKYPIEGYSIEKIVWEMSNEQGRRWTQRGGGGVAWRTGASSCPCGYPCPYHMRCSGIYNARKRERGADASDGTGG